MRDDHVKQPTGARLETIKKAFAAKGFVNCMGAIDGSHVKIQTPTYLENNEDYYCVRKGCNTVQMQAVCDHEGVFWDTVVGRPGCVHDARVLSNSDIYRNHDNIMIGGPKVLSTGQNIMPYILGDSGYSNTPWLVTVFPGHDQALPREKRRFNFAHASARNVIERSFGRMKGRWRILLTKVRHKVELVPAIMMCCIILHNWLISKCDFNEEVDEEELGRDDSPVIAADNVAIVGSVIPRDLLLQHVNSKWNSLRKRGQAVTAIVKKRKLFYNAHA